VIYLVLIKSKRKNLTSWLIVTVWARVYCKKFLWKSLNCIEYWGRFIEIQAQTQRYFHIFLLMVIIYNHVSFHLNERRMIIIILPSSCTLPPWSLDLEKSMFMIQKWSRDDWRRKSRLSLPAAESDMSVDECAWRPVLQITFLMTL
jgi:hypothetical protein